MPESSAPRPPVAASWLVDLFVPSNQTESIPGDLLEEFTEKAAHTGLSAARRWYIRQVAGTITHLIALQLRASPWTIIGAAAGGILMMSCGERAAYSAMAILLAQFPVYEYVKPGIVWLIHAAAVRMLWPLIIGWGVAAISKGREMAVAVILSGVLSIAVFPWLLHFVWLPPVYLDGLPSTLYFHATSLIRILLPPVCVLIGAAIRRRRACLGGGSPSIADGFQ